MGPKGRVTVVQNSLPSLTLSWRAPELSSFDTVLTSRKTAPDGSVAIALKVRDGVCSKVNSLLPTRSAREPK
jgi:hypothetical protein